MCNTPGRTHPRHWEGSQGGDTIETQSYGLSQNSGPPCHRPEKHSLSGPYRSRLSQRECPLCPLDQQAWPHSSDTRRIWECVCRQTPVWHCCLLQYGSELFPKASNCWKLSAQCSHAEGLKSLERKLVEGCEGVSKLHFHKWINVLRKGLRR